MNTVVLGLGLGVGAAIVDVAPMLAQRLPAAATASAVAQWLVMGVVISNCELGLPGWATGMIIGFASALPIVIVVAGNAALVRPGEGAKTVVIMLVNAIVLGGAIGLASRMIAR